MPRKTKIGTEVAHVTNDSDTTSKDKRSKVKGQRSTCGGGGGGILWRPPAQLVENIILNFLRYNSEVPQQKSCGRAVKSLNIALKSEEA